MPVTYAQLTDSKKTIVRRKVFDQVLHDVNACFTPQAYEVPPAWLPAENHAIFLDLRDRCLRAEVSNLYFIIKIYSDAALRAALNAETLSRAQAMTFAGETEEIHPPITGEDTGI